MLMSRDRDMGDGHEGGRVILLVALALLPLAALVGVAIDFGMSFVMRQKLDAVAQSALASALAQSRSLRDGRFEVSIEEMELKGRGRADLVFNAQKPNLRDIRTTFTLERNGAVNVFDARVAYVASLNTVFLRFVGLQSLEIEGSAATTWVARDALIDDKFEDVKPEVIASGRAVLPAPSGWVSSARTRIGGAPVMQLAAAERYDGPPPPDGVKVAVELDTADGNVAISKKFTAEPGAHQLRYWVRDRARDDHVAPAWLCGTREEDVEWMGARDRSPAGDTNRLGVYLSADANNAAPAGAALNAATRIDSCFSSGYRWIERAVKIDILTRGDYWLTFRGEGRPDGVGAAVANILFCREPCADNGGLAPASSNYPWAPGDLILEEKFASSAQAAEAGQPLAGWQVWPGRSIKPIPGQGGSTGFIELDTREGEDFVNQRIGRPVLLTPGFYQLRYAYSAGPASANRAIACNYFGLEAALQVAGRGPALDTRRITLIIDPDGPYLHPEANPDEGGRVSWYTAGRVLDRDIAGLKRQMMPDLTNAVDFCVGAPPNAVVNREVNFRIDKAGYYWITFAADGPADGEGGRIGAVQLFARGTRFSGQGIPRIIRYIERGDIVTPPVGALLVRPPASTGGAALYRVQVQ